MNVFSNAPTKLFKLAPVSIQENKCCNEKNMAISYSLCSYKALLQMMSTSLCLVLYLISVLLFNNVVISIQ